MDFDFDFDFDKKRIQVVFFIVGIIALSITADKCRQLVGEDFSSQSGKFTIFNCFDMSTGTMACTVKEGVKLYFYNIRSSHVERARSLATQRSLVDALAQGLSAKDAAKQAEKEGKKAAKLAKRQANRVIGPIISSGWDFFEAIYYGGTITEGFLRGSGTLVGAFAGGFLGEARVGRFGYLVGSHMGSWIGGRIGLMLYDVVSGVHYFLQVFQGGEGKTQESFGTFEASEDYQVHETPEYTSADASEASTFYESPSYESSETYENSEFR
ncbi:uncharacterized protein [Euphorbia lathyris]|uniref:uncharacterized protein n=1 Tax=Euphorbia lathyris TaxID=212925 RepID=UPI0033132E3F